MIAVIPAKANSTRVPRKNWRDFHYGKCLVDIAIDNLKAAGFNGSDIFVSSEDVDALQQCNRRHGVCTLTRCERLTHNETSIRDFMCGIMEQIGKPSEDEVMWYQVCNPFVNADCLNEMKFWWKVKCGGGCLHDSFVLCQPAPHYVINEHFQPLGWSFGSHHTPSQKLSPKFTMPFSVSIMRRETLEDVGYHVGRNPAWYEFSGPAIDIDTEDDFENARLLYNARLQSDYFAGRL